MSNLIPTEESAVRAWLEHLASRIATSGVGVALLDAQITALEKTCAELRESSQLRAQFRDELGSAIITPTKVSDHFPVTCDIEVGQ